MMQSGRNFSCVSEPEPEKFTGEAELIFMEQFTVMCLMRFTVLENTPRMGRADGFPVEAYPDAMYDFLSEFLERC